jgi:predicted kinase
MLGVVFGSSSGPWESYVFARLHPASGRVASRNGQTVVDITGLRKGSREMIKLEMSEAEWHNLEAVREVLLEQLEQHRMPAERSDATAPPASANDASSTGAYDGSTSWIFVTGRRRDTGEIATIAVLKKQWGDLSPLQWAVKKALRGQGSEPAILRGGLLIRIAAIIGLLVFFPLYLMALGLLFGFLDYLWHLFR